MTQQQIINFPNQSRTRRPLATLANLETLLSAYQFKILQGQYCSAYLGDFRLCKANFLDGLIPNLLKNPHLISLCAEHELSKTVLKDYFVEVSKNFIEVLPPPPPPPAISKERQKLLLSTLKKTLNTEVSE